MKLVLAITILLLNISCDGTSNKERAIDRKNNEIKEKLLVERENEKELKMEENIRFYDVQYVLKVNSRYSNSDAVSYKLPLGNGEMETVTETSLVTVITLENSNSTVFSDTIKRSTFSSKLDVEYLNISPIKEVKVISITDTLLIFNFNLCAPESDHCENIIYSVGKNFTKSLERKIGTAP